MLINLPTCLMIHIQDCFLGLKWLNQKLNGLLISEFQKESRHDLRRTTHHFCIVSWKKLKPLAQSALMADIEFINQNDKRPKRNTSALCAAFWQAGCTRCPVCKKTGAINCMGTPKDVQEFKSFLIAMTLS